MPALYINHSNDLKTTKRGNGAYQEHCIQHYQWTVLLTVTAGWLGTKTDGL